MPKRNPFFRLPSDIAIVEAVLKYNKDRVIGASYNIGRRYRLPPEDREELVSHAHYKLVKVLWRVKFRQNTKWVREHYPSHPCTWTASEVAKVMNGYAFTIIRKSMLDEVRRLRCMGRTGLGLHPVDTIDPLHRIVEDAEDATSDDEWSVDDSVFARDGQENRYAAHQIAQRAFIVLTPEEWSCVSLAYGFDGGGIRTPTQVAREAGLPRKKTQELLDGAMEKMKALT